MESFNNEQFESLLEEIDITLRDRDIAIQQRPVEAAVEFSERTGIYQPLFSGTLDKQGKQTYPDRIYEWYDRRYGDRLKVNMSPGSTVILIKEEPWKVVFPRIYGQVLFDLSKCIEGIPQQLLTSLSPDEKETLKSTAIERMDIAHGLDAHSINIPLLRKAMQDLSEGVSHLCSAPRDLSQAKWCFSQAGEKAIKGFIESQGKKFAKTHNLKNLEARARWCGLEQIPTTTLEALICPGGARYLTFLCSQHEAIVAHDAAYEVFRTVVETLRQG